MITEVFAACVGLSQGLISGTALSAVMRVLGIHRRLKKRLGENLPLEMAALVGAVIISLWQLLDIRLALPDAVAMLIGLGGGIYLGMLTASLAEMVYILPDIAQKLNMQITARAIALTWLMGKVTGSFLYWLEPLWQH